MKTKLFSILLMALLSTSMYSQTGSIINTIGTNGSFTIGDGTTTFFSLPQNTGTITFTQGINLPTTYGAEIGVIYKGSRFIHNFQATGTTGNNTFVGINAGNFTMSGSGNAASYNTAVGAQSMVSNTTGSFNSAVGVGSLQSNTEGYDNSAFGLNSLYSNTTGYMNSAVGYASLFSNSTGTQNSAFGMSSLQSNTSGADNSAFGNSSLFHNTTGYNNSAFGEVSLPANTTGHDNSAFGINSLSVNTTGSDNSAFGEYALSSNTEGLTNAAFGEYSLFSNTTGYNNSAFGKEAGYLVSTGSNLTLIGYAAEPSSGAASDQVTLGNGSVGALRCNVQTITSLSDARDKKNIQDLQLGIDFLMKIKPRQFNWDRREWYENEASDGTKMQKKPTAGFIAQELDKVQTSENAEWLNLVLKENPNRLEATPGNLLPIVVKAIQELKEENDTIKKENEKLAKENLKLQKDIAAISSSISEKVREEVKAVLLKAAGSGDSAEKVSMNTK